MRNWKQDYLSCQATKEDPIKDVSFDTRSSHTPSSLRESPLAALCAIIDWPLGPGFPEPQQPRTSPTVESHLSELI